MSGTRAVAAPFASTSADAAMRRYQGTERALWDHYGLEPSERFIELASLGARLRIREVGSGEPVLFVHGTGGPGAWPALVRELKGVRCIMLERPGWGLSSPVDFKAHDYNTLVADLLRDVLDSLGLDRAHVAGASIGNNWALRLAQRHPSRVAGIVLLGGGPMVPEIEVPPFIKLLASPLGAAIVRLPQKPKMIAAQLRGLGHGASLDAGRIPDELIRWRQSLSRDTDSMRHERAMVRAIVSARGFRPGLTFENAELAAIRQPTLHVYGTADPTGSVEIWKRAAALLPRGELQLVEGGGHVPWFDDAGGVAGHVRRFVVA